MRLIDAHKLLDDIETNKDTVDIVDIVESIIMSPTVDAVPVIRCKECKWWRSNKKECIEWYDSPYSPADGYCFRAERKEE